MYRERDSVCTYGSTEASAKAATHCEIDGRGQAGNLLTCAPLHPSAATAAVVTVTPRAEQGHGGDARADQWVDSITKIAVAVRNCISREYKISIDDYIIDMIVIEKSILN